MCFASKGGGCVVYVKEDRGGGSVGAGDQVATLPTVWTVEVRLCGLSLTRSPT